MTTTNIPMSGAEFVASCKRWGLAVVEHAGWENRNRNGDGRAWGPINGFVVHNFASDISDVSSIDYLIRGDLGRGMPGPLSQLALDDLGRVHLIGWGRANHVGTGDPVILDRVIRDDVPLNGEMRVTPRHNAVSCTHRFVGVEMLYGKAPTAAQRAALPKLCAAFLSVMGWAATSVIGHREISMSKAADGVFRADRSDPVGFDMGTVRRQVQALLRTGPGSTLSNPVGTLPTPAPAAPKEDDMPTAKEVWDQRLTGPDGEFEASAAAWLTYANAKVDRVSAEIVGLTAAIKTLAESKDIDGDAVVEAVRSEVAKAMQGFEVTLSTKPDGA